MPKHPHILNAASNLLGIALLIIAGLHVAGRARTTFADEVAWIAALAFALACLFSYAALRSARHGERFEHFADLVFMGGLVLLVLAVAVLAIRV